MKTLLLIIGFSLGGILTSLGQAQTVSLTLDPTQSSVAVNIGGSGSGSFLSGTATVDIQSFNPPAGDAQVTDLNLILDNAISTSFSLGLLAGTTTPGDVSISMVTPGAPGTIAGGNFSQLANSLTFGGDLNVIDQFGLAGGNQTIDLSTIQISPTDFNSVSVTQSGDVITVTSSFSFTENLNLLVGPIPMVVSGTFVASGTAPDSMLIGDVNLDGVVNMADILPFIAILVNRGFQGQADINQSGAVNFLDISPFVQILLQE